MAYLNKRIRTSHSEFDYVLSILRLSDLTPEDHGEYICRLYDFDRNVMAERRVPVSVYSKQI